MAGPDFDSIKHLNPYNVEYWEARELMPLLGYGNKQVAKLCRRHQKGCWYLYRLRVYRMSSCKRSSTSHQETQGS
jgi:hypothetical protein